MAKFTSLFTIAALVLLVLLVLLSSELTSTARMVPASTNSNLNTVQHLGAGPDENSDVEDTCQGLNEEECLMRRTLAAHVDYIYTQKHHKP